ncbi:MAG: dihydroneopterin aldolase [Planctomycetota bacterium]
MTDHLPGFDTVFVRNLRAWTLIGIHPHEREGPQEVVVTALLGTDTHAAAARDDIHAAIDYRRVSERLRQHAGAAQHWLIETLAEDMAGICLEEFGAQVVRLTVEKPGVVPGADSVGVTIERRRGGA